MRRPRHLIASAIALSLVATSTAARASAAPQYGPSGDAWLTLSMMTPSGTVGLGGSSVAAAQPVPPPADYHHSSTPPWPVIGIWLAVIALDIYLLLKDDSHNNHPNSPI
jgi:hypothetical protein